MTSIHRLLVAALLCGVSVTAAAQEVIVFNSDRNQTPGAWSLFSVNADGTGLHDLTPGWPATPTVETAQSVSPDGQRLAFVAWHDGLYVMNLDGTGRQLVTADAEFHYTEWTADGSEILFNNPGTCAEDTYATTLDGSRRRLVVDAGVDFPQSAVYWVSRSVNDELAVVGTYCYGDTAVYLMSMDRSDVRLLLPHVNTVDWAPDAQTLAVSIGEGASWRIWAINRDGTGLRPLAPDNSVYAAWSPDGSRIAYISFDGASSHVFVTNADGSGVPRQVTFGEGVHDWNPVWGRIAEANAGPDQSVNEQALVILDGSGSRGTASMTFTWEQLAGPSVVLLGETSVAPSFVAPTLVGGISGNQTLTFKLTVVDGAIVKSDTMDVTVKNVNHGPVADAGPAQRVAEGSPVMLSATQSYDPDADPITTYAWTQLAGPPVELSDPTTVRPTFTAPTVPGGLGAGTVLEFRLTVSDSLLTSESSVSITVEQVNHRPIAHAGLDQTRDEGAIVALGAGGSSDPDGDLLSYSWVQTEGSTVVLSDLAAEAPTFLVPEVGMGGTRLVFRLAVSDGDLSSVPDDVVINVLDVNDPPLCEAARPSDGLLWPPNHKLVSVGIVGISDPQGDAVAIAITDVTQDETVNGLGDGDTAPDAVLQGAKVLLRAERSGSANGRVYRVLFTADDGRGGVCAGAVTVGVPQSNRPGQMPVDDGQSYNSLRP